MEKITQNIEDTDHNCQFCTRSFKSEQGLKYHMKKIHPLDLTSGLSCYTCNKTFTKRDLIENHFKTVKHQLECKKLFEEEKREQNCQIYRKLLMKMDNSKTRPISVKTWDLNRKIPLNIPLESTSKLEDPRLNRRKRQAILDPRPKKSRKLNSEDLSKKQLNLAEKDNFEDTSIELCENHTKQDIPETMKEDKPKSEEIYTENCIAAKPSNEGRSTLFSTKIPDSYKTIQDLPENTESVQIDGIPSKSNEINSTFQDLTEDTSKSKEIYIANCIAAKPSNEGRSTLFSAKTPNSYKTIQNPTENPEFTQIDVIPCKSDEIQSIFQDPIEKSEEQQNSSPGTRSTLKQLPPKDSQDLVEIYLSTSEEDTIDQDLDKFITEYLEKNLIETRTVKLNNEWRITDSIGTPDFPELLKEDPNFNLLTFITEKMPF